MNTRTSYFFKARRPAAAQPPRLCTAGVCWGLLTMLGADLALPAAEVGLAWDPSPDPRTIAYRVYWGTRSQAYTHRLEVGAGTSATVTGLNVATTYYFAATALAPGGWESNFSNEVQYTTPPLPTNQPPALGFLADRTIAEDSSTGPIAFTVGDADNDPATLRVSAVSSNPTLVPASGLVLGGRGAIRTLTVTPAIGRSGKANVSVIVSDGALAATRTFELTVVPRFLPAPWLAANLGRPEPTGSARHVAGVFTLETGGREIGGFADEGFFLYRPLSGDGAITARVQELEGILNYRAGVMIREKLDDTARMVFLHLSPYTLSLSYRISPGSYAFSTYAGPPRPAPNNWLRLVRTGSTITAFASPDGATWNPVSLPVTLGMGTEVWVGLAASSDFIGRRSRAVFDQVSVVP